MYDTDDAPLPGVPNNLEAREIDTLFGTLGDVLKAAA
jgi:hypothetical protein